jgi:hypothetical protein
MIINLFSPVLVLGFLFPVVAFPPVVNEVMMRLFSYIPTTLPLIDMADVMPSEKKSR